MAEELDLLELLTQPLSEAELAKYKEVLDSESFDDMVRHYHASAAIAAIRQIVIQGFNQGLMLETMVALQATVWLDIVEEFDQRIKPASLNIWREIPLVLTQILVQNALIDLTQQEPGQLKEEIAPELFDLYEQWEQVSPLPIYRPLTDAEVALQSQLAEQLYAQIKIFRPQLEQKSGLQLSKGNYLEVWAMVLMQTYLFGYGNDPNLYYLVETNWALVLDTLAQTLDLLTVLDGMEHLLLPENRNELNAMIEGGAFSAFTQAAN